MLFCFKMTVLRHICDNKNQISCIVPRIVNIFHFTQRNFSSEAPESETEKPPPAPKRVPKEVSAADKRSHKVKLGTFFLKNPHVEAVRQHIPEKYLSLKRVTPSDHLYLIDSKVAEKVVKYVLPDLRKHKDQVICETNTGLGLITSELLKNEIKPVRVFEACPEFRTYLKNKFEDDEDHVELVPKDFFLLSRYEYIDKQDHGNRVEQLFCEVPKKEWDEDPAMTIIGALPNIRFIRHLMKTLVLQSQVVSHGRLQFYIFMKPRDYIILTAGPHLNLHTYQRSSVMFNLLFDYQMLEKFPKEIFLPWESPKTQPSKRYPAQIDPDCMYFVRINFKKKLPVAAENLLPLFSFVDQFFGRGSKKVIPTLEKWVPGCGANVMVPTLNHEEYFKDINIFTKFGQLTPGQILSVFKETIHHPAYEKNHFLSMIETQLVKTETIETTLEEYVSEKVENREKVKPK